MSELIPTEDGETVSRGQPEVIGLPIDRGWGWIVTAWGLFMRAPLMWIAFVVVVMVIFSMASIIPILGHIAVNLFWPVFIGGIMAGCATLDEGGELEFEHLLAGFNEKLKPLLVLGAVYVGMMIGVLVIVMLLAFVLGLAMGTGMESLTTGDVEALNVQSVLFLLLIGLMMMALMVPVAMATWFAPSLIMLGDHGVIDAIKLSFLGCLKNILPFLWYGIIVMVLAFGAVITLFIGFAVLMPIVCLSVYAAYREIYNYN